MSYFKLGRRYKSPGLNRLDRVFRPLLGLSFVAVAIVLIAGAPLGVSIVAYLSLAIFGAAQASLDVYAIFHGEKIQFDKTAGGRPR